VQKLNVLLDALKGRRGWIISDGRAGNDVQLRGVFDALGLPYEIKRVAPRAPFKWLAPWGPISPAERFAAPGSPFAPPFPDFAIAAGRRTTPYLRALKRSAGNKVFTIILQHPGVGLKAADLFWVPRHDTLHGPNVIKTLTSPHSFTERRLAGLRRTIPPAIAALARPRVAVMLGGSNGVYSFTPQALARLSAWLKDLSQRGAGLMITPSRRTEAKILDAVRGAIAGTNAYLWDMSGSNPYPDFLAHADVFIATADSVNMTGEPCATGKPVYVFYPDAARLSANAKKFREFHRELEASGATRPLPGIPAPLQTWAYEPVNSSEFIAYQIAERWLDHVRRLAL
jgi:mitochondrial fission protein ELM1